MTRSRTWVVVSAVCVPLTLLGFQVMAQEAENQAVFGTTVEVRVVNVEAVVTDADGGRVTGLDAGDFRLFVDGEEVPVDYFSEISEGDLTAAPDGAKQLPPPPSLVADGPGQTVGTSYLLFIDEYFPLKTDRDRTLRGLAEWIEAMGPSDRMAVLAYDGNGVTTLSDWSGDTRHLLDVMDRAQERDTGGYTRYHELTTVESNVELKHYVERLKEQTISAVAAASSSLRTVELPLGRKVMVLLSGGWALDPSKLLPADDRRYMTRRGFQGGKEILAPLTDTANLLGYTIYPIDVPGFRPAAGQSAAERGFELSRDSFPLRQPLADGENLGSLEAVESMDIPSPETRPDQRELEDQYALQHMAEETGGQAMLHAGIGDAFEDTRTYYWLGFSPEVKGDNQRHEIRVEAVRSGLKVRTRQSFVDFSQEKQTTMRVETALMSGSTPGAPSLEVTVGEIQQAPKKMVLVPLEVTIPTDLVSATETASGFEIRLELRAAAIDDWGNPSEIPVVPVLFTSSHPPAPGGHATYRTTIQLRRADHELLVTVYDPRMDQLLAKRLEVDL